MLRFALFVIVIGTLIGAMMPSGYRSASSNERTEHRGGERLMAKQTGLQATADGPGVILERDRDGHFYAEVEVNGTPVRFLVDTGASGIALARKDAERVAVPLAPGQSDTVVGRGASGEVTGQFVTLDHVALGATEVREARAVMLDGGEQSLLGQSFLNEFDSVEIHGDRMILR
jgi:aspartyl protease family protein